MAVAVEKALPQQREVEEETLLLKAPIRVKKGQTLIFDPASSSSPLYSAMALHVWRNVCAKHGGKKCVVEKIKVMESEYLKTVKLDVKFEDGQVMTDTPVEDLVVPTQ